MAWFALTLWVLGGIGIYAGEAKLRGHQSLGLFLGTMLLWPPVVAFSVARGFVKGGRNAGFAKTEVAK